MSSTTPIHLLYGLRTVVGIGSLLFPVPFFRAAGIPMASDDTILLTRLFGARDFVLAALLYTAYRASPPATGSTGAVMSNELRRALTAGLAVDAIDVCSNLVGYADGEIGKLAFAWFGGGAVFFTALGFLPLYM